ncbi:oligosaccharide flippase family protein [Falsiroseomonas sp. HW251]|uniref:oligosaccharide flippase family protein n=1 Tax=Falsiroseomonas sp. HW251 TaxID=3390998 RepID=UPI003D324323
MRLPSSRSPVWVLAETATSALFSLFSMLAIGRVIGPEAAGTGMIAIASFALLDLIGSTLFPDALVQHRAPTARHAASALTCATLVGAAMGVVLAVFGPLMARWSAAPAVEALCWVLAPLLPISAFAGAGAGLLLRDHRYAPLAARVLVGQPLALAAGLGLAASGHGPWAMIANQAVATVVAFAIVLGFGRLWLRPMLDRGALRELWPVALPQVAALAVLIGRYRLFLVLLGLVTTESVLAVSHFAFRMLDAALVVVWQSIGRIAMPRLCGLQGDRHAQAEAFGDIAQLLALLGMPIAAGVALTAPDLVHALLGPAWQDAAGAARIVGVAALLTFVNGDPLSLFVARGKARWNLYVNLVSLTVPLVALLVIRPQTAEGAALAWASQSLVLPPLLTWLALREVKRPWTWLLAKLAPGLVSTAAMAAVVLALQATLRLSSFLDLAVSGLAGATVYAAVAWIMLRGRIPRALLRHPVAATA